MENELIQKLLDFNPEPAFIAARNGVILLCNKALKDMSGIDNPCSTDISAMIFPGEEEKLLRLFKGESNKEEICCRSKKGTISLCTISSFEFDDKRILCSLKQVSFEYQNFLREEIFNLEKSNRQTEQRFGLIAEKTTELISMVSDKKYIYMSPSYEKTFGYTNEELQKLGPRALVHPDDQHLLNDWRKKGMLEFRVRNKNGDWLWVEGESFVISGEPEIVVGLARNITKRKKAEEALKENEKRYRVLFESNPLPMFVYDVETLKYLAVNDAAVRHYKYSREEFLSMTVKDIRPPSDIPFLLDIFANQNTRIRRSGVWKHIKKDGELINVDVTAHEINFNGRPARLVLANDVTEKVHAEKALMESEEKYRRIVENVNEGIVMINADTIVTFVNPKITGILGYAKEEAEGRPIFDFIFDEEREAALNYLSQNKEGMSETFEFRLKHKNGSEVWVLANAVPIFDEDENYTGGVAMITDVTHEREAEAVLQRTNERLRALVNYSPLSIIMLDGEGQVELWNPASEKLFGWSSEEVMGTTLPTVPSERYEEHVGLRNLVLDGESFTGKEVIRKRKNGKKFNVSISAAPLLDSDKKPIGISAFLMDITDRKIVEKERERLFNQIDNARKRLKALSSKLIHVQETEKRNISIELHDEIGQILTAIKIDLDRIKKEALSKDAAVLLDDCTSLVEKTISIIRNLSHELRPSIIDDLGLSAALRWYADKFAQRTNIKVNTHIAKIDNLFQPESAITLFRICQEALTNIAKHSQADYVRISLVQENGTVALSVEDNGKGFEMKKALKLAAQGKSLGLLSMQERVDLLNGKLKITSSKSTGTKIKVTYRV